MSIQQIPLSPVELVLRVAAATEGATEAPPNSNAGPFVERVLNTTGTPKGAPWCAAYVAMVGVAALGDDWRLVKTAGCAALGEFAKAKGMLSEAPMRGDVFLVWFEKLGRFAHTGFVVDVIDSTHAMTISGNTTIPGRGGDSREGWAVVRKVWTFGPKDRFIRWSLL